jgi:peptidyl-prolyl cis-trans isomerase A (cyclophilin A)
MFKKIFIVLTIATLVGCAARSNTQPKESDDPKQLSDKYNPVAILETNMGSMVLELYADKAPRTVENFIKLAENGFYNGVIFHRVIKDFMIQGGDPTGTGTGGPGYSIKDEIHPTLKHDKEGVLAMAHHGPNTGGSQFYITLKSTPWLDGGYTIFGQLIRGSDTLQNIGKVPTGRANRPLNDIVIRLVTIQQ